MIHDSKPIFKVFLFFLTLTFSFMLIISPEVESKREHIVHFPNTVYELNIYKIYGKKPGKTLMLIGGIQGNEPGGFLSADLYADMSLEKGNLIVVPRANFYSIILNKRGPNGDMNRKFAHEDISSSMEDKIVTILKDLIRQSDFLLNLHDGAGFYYPEYVDKWRNPMRFGQSIIADCDEYRIPETGAVIPLGEMARKVVNEVNAHIQNELYKFHFMNTRTFDNDSPHREQRRSATYYALVKHHIPAFGIETSKFLPSIDLKVRYHNLVINAFKKLFDIVPESPGMVLDPPELKYLVVSINGQTPIVLKETDALQIAPGDAVNVTHIEANYERGLSLDILGYGDLNDYRKDFVIHRDTTLVVRKDNSKFAEIPIKISRSKAGLTKEASLPSSIDGFVIETKGHRMLFSNGETLQLTKGDKLKILDVLPAVSGSSGIIVNFKGFVGDKKNNTGEDRGFLIDTGTDLLERYSLDKRRERYIIVVSHGEKTLGKLYVELLPPKMDYLILRVNHHKHIFLRSEDKVSLSSNDQMCLEEIQSNLFNKSAIRLSINGNGLKLGEVRRVKELFSKPADRHLPAQVKIGDHMLGRIFIEMD